MEKDELKSMSFNKLERELSSLKKNRYEQRMALDRIWVKLGNKRYSINYARLQYMIVNYDHDDQESIRLKENFNKRLDSYFEINTECLMYAEEMKRRRELRKLNRNVTKPNYTIQLKEVEDEIKHCCHIINEVKEALSTLKQEIGDLDKELKELQYKRELTPEDKIKKLEISSRKQEYLEKINKYKINLMNAQEKLYLLNMRKQFITNSFTINE